MESPLAHLELNKPFVKETREGIIKGDLLRWNDNGDILTGLIAKEQAAFCRAGCCGVRWNPKQDLFTLLLISEGTGSKRRIRHRRNFPPEFERALWKSEEERAELINIRKRERDA